MVHCGQWTPAPIEPEPPANRPDVDAALDYSRSYEYRFKDVDQDARQLVWNEIARVPLEPHGPADAACSIPPAVAASSSTRCRPTSGGSSTSSTTPSARPIPAVRIVIGDLFEIELPPAYFDGVFASNLLEHFHSPEEVAAFLDRMRETLAPGRGARAHGPELQVLRPRLLRLRRSPARAHARVGRRSCSSRRATR